MQRSLVERELTSEGPSPKAPRRGGRSVTVNLAESPLTWLHSRGHLSDRLFAAGELLRADWERARLSQGLTMRWDAVRIKGGPNSGLTLNERQIAAKQRFDGAIVAAGPGLEDVLWRVVCAGETLPIAEKALDWPVRNGKLVLKIALERVADFYRIAKGRTGFDEQLGDRPPGMPSHRAEHSRAKGQPMERRHFLAGASASTILLASASSALAAAKPSNADARLKALLDKLFNSNVDNSPTTATQLALDKGARATLRSRLDDNSKAGRARSDARDRAGLASLRSFNSAGLSEQGKLHLANALYLNERAVVPQKFGLRSVQRPYVIAQNGGAYFSIPDFLGSVHPVESAVDGKAYLSRLAAFATALDNDTALQTSEAARGYVAPGWSLDLALGQMRKLRQPAAEANTLTRSLADRAKAKGIAGNWSADAAAIVEKSVYPALDRQIALVERLRKTTPAGDGFWRLPRGPELYAEALASATTTNMTPDEVHAIGLEQVADLTARLEVILKGAGLTTGSVGDRLTALNARADQVYPNTDAGRKELIDGLNAGVEAMWARLPQAFNDVPRKPLEIRRVPAEIQDGASNGYYYRAPMDGSRPAIYWINLKDTADWPKYQLPSLTYHEGLPGHHLQLSYVNAAGALPDYLRNVFISAYGEGWALYSEQLADELGAYSGIESAGYLQSFLFRAARLVVDTGLHHKRWSREKAADYLVATTGFARGRGLREVERYCTSGGQACSYKIGHNKWLELRARAQAALGDKFTLPWFHDVLREGIMPLSLLEQRVNERITARLKG